jgi:VanZ family protein
MKKFILYWLPVLIWASAIFYSSSQPYDKQDIKPLLGGKINVEKVEPYIDEIKVIYVGQEVSVHTKGVEGFIEFFIRKGAHFTVFMVLAFLIYRAFRGSGFSYKKSVIFAPLIAVLYASSDEFHQSLTINRTPMVADVIIDTAGIIMAMIIVSVRHFSTRYRSA